MDPGTATRQDPGSLTSKECMTGRPLEGKHVGDASKRTVQTAVGLAAAGFLLIVLGWNGAASLDYVQGQVPYLISGGLAGLALVGMGLTFSVINEMRRTNTQLLRALEQLGERLEHSTGAGPTEVPRDGTGVVAGRTTYHDPACRLVKDRSDLQVMAPQAASDRGLAPCRICEPKRATASA